jgi:glutathione S-transferase
MMKFTDTEELIKLSGLRLIIVRQTPSPWSQAAKAMIEYKGLDYAIGGHEIGGENEAEVAWSHQNSGPVVAWNDEPPRSNWLDILHLLERIAPDKPLLPADAAERAKMIGLSYEICAELGIGWNLRLRLFRPFMEGAETPEMVLRMGEKYRYNATDTALANERLVARLNLLSAELQGQVDRGHQYFLGESLSALDFYWAAFCNIALLPSHDWIPLAPEWRAMFIAPDPAVDVAITPALRAHRDHMMETYFRIPMEI